MVLLEYRPFDGHGEIACRASGRAQLLLPVQFLRRDNKSQTSINVVGGESLLPFLNSSMGRKQQLRESIAVANLGPLVAPLSTHDQHYFSNGCAFALHTGLHTASIPHRLYMVYKTAYAAVSLKALPGLS